MRPNTISNYEKGNSSPDFKLLGILVEIFDVDAHSFLYTDLRRPAEPETGFPGDRHPRAGAAVSEPPDEGRSEAGYDDRLRKMQEEIEGLRETVHELFEEINR